MKEMRKEPKKKKLKVLEKQKLRDMEHKISADVSTFLILLEEGSEREIDEARKKARADLLKWSSEMQSIAQTLSGEYSETVKGYLDTMDTVLHCPTKYVDQEKINRWYHSQQDLEKML